MLKWLKKQPTNHILRGGISNNNDGSHEVGQNKIITDDPLATIQVNPQQKKSKNKSEEIYAVSRVNPLFEEEEVPKVVLGGGNQSGSSGYDSGSQTHSDDDELKSPHRQRTDALSSTSSTSSFSVLSRAPAKHGQLFRDEDDPVVHSQAAILSANGRPVLHIVEQNPDFVHSIAVSVGGGRPLSPIDETNLHPNVKSSYHLTDAIFPKHNSNSTKVSVHPVPTRNNQTKAEDNIGVAKIVHKENRYVQSIVIGAPSPEGGKSATLSSVTRLSQTPVPPPLALLPPLSKKPSVTFSEMVELVAPKETNDKVLIKQRQPPPYRKPSAEQDSIVTESLLLLTSSKPLELNKGNGNNSSNNANRLVNHHSSKSSKSGERKSSSSSCSSSGISSGDGSGGLVQRNQRAKDLEDFSSSICKNHPVKHILSNSGKSLEINQAADHYSSNEYVDHHNNRHTKHKKGCDNSDDQDSTYSEAGSSASHKRRSDDDDRDDDGKRQCLPRGSCPKSPFGGIADHYAAAKEIAKEIESYSNGSAKTSSKKSIVRDLLSGRGREALAFHTAVRKAAAAAEFHKSGSFYAQQQQFGHAQEASSPQRHGNYPVSNDAIEEWESVRVQQVYLKGRSWKEVEPPSSSSALSSASSQEDGDRFRFAGQRVMSIIQQGQVHSNKKDTIVNGTTTTSNAASIHSHPQPSPSSSKQHLKSSIYGGDGLSSEGASSHNEGDDDASSDSGNSTDRNSKGSRPVLVHDRRTTISRSKIPVKAPDPSSRPSDEGTLGGELSHMDKVMIVTGDSQNMVVDLSGVPQDLREAIISGTALITLPDGLTASSAKKGGYTIISLPNNNSSPSINANPSSPTPPYRPPSTGAKSTDHKKKSPLSTSQTEAENEIKVIPTIPSTSVNINVSQLERGELYDHIFNPSNFTSKNKTRVWDMMQQSVQQTLIEGENGKKKRITTVLPFHPNQDVYKSPDFTMEGHRLEHQRKKLDIAKKRRCACRVFGIFFFLATFIGVLVALSMIYTKGQRYFGSV